MRIKERAKGVLSFYVTIGVPLLYGVNLWLVAQKGEMVVAEGVTVIAGLMVVVGLSLWVVSYLHLKEAFGVLPRRQARVSSGVYGVIRHPMYLGILFSFIGLAVLNGSGAGLVFCLLVLLPILLFRSWLEERALD